MRYRFLIFATTLVAAQFAVAQSGISGSCDATFCKMTFTFGPIGMPLASAASAAYSGQQTMEYVQTKGTHITSKSSRFSAMTYRDSQGRVRTERPMFPSHPGSKSAVNVILVEIQDPLAGYLYVLDSVNHVAHRVPVQPLKPILPPVPVEHTLSAIPTGYTSTSESLGTQFMFGVTLIGQKTTTTTPAGSRMGNDQPVTTVSEIWTDPRTNLVVLRKTTSPTGDSTMTVQNYSNAEPDPALFLVPADYQLADETGSFTIVIPRAQN